MRRNCFIGLTLGLVALLIMVSCNNSLDHDFDEPLNIFSDLTKVPGASNTTIIVNKGENVGRNSTFQIEVSGLENSTLITSGKYDAWCLEWGKTMRSNNDVHKGVKWYSSLSNENWKPLNYFFSIKNELQAADPSLTFREMQGVIWSLAGFINIAPAFDIDKVENSQLPAGWFENGQELFSKDKIKSIVNRVKDEFKNGDLKFASNIDEDKGCIIGETDSEEQNVCIEPPDDVELTIKIQDLGILPTTSGAFIDEAYARAINDHGEIVGNQWITVCLDDACDSIVFENQGFRWTQDGGLEHVLMFDDNGFVKSPPNDINNEREVVGFDQFSAAFLDYPPPTGSGATIIGGLLGGDPTESNALAINDHSQVVGFAENEQGYKRAFIWDLERGITDIGALTGGIESRAVDINNSGQVVGWSQGSPSDNRQYFLWDNENGMFELGTDPIRSINDNGEVSSSIAINNLGQTVNEDGFLYDPVMGAIDLGTLEGGGSCKALDLNNSSQVAGWCINSAGEPRAVRWTVTFEKDKLVYN